MHRNKGEKAYKEDYAPYVNDPSIKQRLLEIVSFLILVHIPVYVVLTLSSLRFRCSWEESMQFSSAIWALHLELSDYLHGLEDMHSCMLCLHWSSSSLPSLDLSYEPLVPPTACHSTNQFHSFPV